MNIRITLSAILFCSFLAFSSSATEFEIIKSDTEFYYPLCQEEVVAGELLVSFSQEIADADGRLVLLNEELQQEENLELDSWNNRFGTIEIQRIHRGDENKHSPIYLLKLNVTAADETVIAAQELERVLKLEGSHYAEPNLKYCFNYDPNDPGYAGAINYHYAHWNFGQTIDGVVGVIDKDMDTRLAWSFTTGSPNIAIGIIDQGLPYHEDLQPNIAYNLAESFAYATDGIDNDGNGYIDDYRGWNFWNDNNNSYPIYPVPLPGTHATRVAGVAAAKGDNSIGMAGTAYDTSIFPCKGTSHTVGGIYTSKAIECLDYIALFDNVKIINMSFGGPTYSSAFYDAISRANDLGKLVVTSSGNAGANNDVLPHYPSSYLLPNVLAVGSCNNQGLLSSFSNYGATSVDVLAPGEDVITTAEDTTGIDAYFLDNGTSFAAPMAAGVAALLLSVHPDISPSRQIRYIMENVDFEGYPVLSGGRVNAYYAIQDLNNGLCGDANDDNQVTVVDALVVAKFSAGLPSHGVINHHFADVDNTGVIGIVDALKIAQNSAGLPVTLVCN
ncbi:S8 family serine peptidase [Bdellovibrionota bacterium]